MVIENVARHKGEFFRMLVSTKRSQAGVMTIPEGGDSGPEEIHSGDQLVYVIEGEADVTVDGERVHMVPGDVVIIPKGARHHIYNTGAEALFCLTAYAPPQY